MLAEMRDSPPPISPIKSPQKNQSDSEDEIPSSQPASTRPKLWNNLPDSIKYAETVKQFISLVKTYLFKEAFD